jgi:hypothetical protein
MPDECSLLAGVGARAGYAKGRPVRLHLHPRGSAMKPHDGRLAVAHPFSLAIDGSDRSMCVRVAHVAPGSRHGACSLTSNHHSIDMAVGMWPYMRKRGPRLLRRVARRIDAVYSGLRCSPLDLDPEVVRNSSAWGPVLDNGRTYDLEFLGRRRRGSMVTDFCPT